MNTADLPRPQRGPLIAKIRSLFQRDLALENDFLRNENRILRGKFVRRVPLTDRDRRLLVKYGLPLGERLADVISIVRPETLLKWNRLMKRAKWTYAKRVQSHKPGRPPKGKDTETLIVRLAEENDWGYTRIAGELLKLGHQVSPSHVRDVLQRHGLPPSPQRKGLSWKQFIQAHLDVTWAADFFTEEVWSLTGLITMYVLVFIHLGTRRIRIAGCTAHPNAEWTQQQARNLSMFLADKPTASPCRYLLHDRDSIFLPFDTIVKSDGIRIVKTPPHAPQCNAYAERCIREIRETLDQLILLGETHLRHVLSRIERHHNCERPHQGLANRVPLGHAVPDKPARPAQVECHATLPGLLAHYSVKRPAA